jgi:hypothetical protein
MSPLVGLTGLGARGVGSPLVRAGGGSIGTIDNPYTSWTAANAAGLSNEDVYIEMGGYKYNVTIDADGYAKFFRDNDEYTLLLWGTAYNTMCGSNNGLCTDIATYTVGNIQGGSQGYDTATSPGNDWINFNWRDADGTVVNAAFFTAMGPQLSTGYKPDSFWLGGNDVESADSWNFRYADGTTDAFDQQDNHGASELSILARNLSSTLQNTWIKNNKILTAFKDSKGSDPAGAIFSWRHSGLAVK